MKHLIIIFISIISVLSCKAQVPLVEKYGNITNGTYYNDVNNDLGRLEGTWQYTNSDETFKIIFIKKENDLVSYADSFYHEDALCGEYRYINPNGFEVNNTLNDLDSYTDISEHLIYGNYILKATDSPVCDDCLPNEYRVMVSIEDPERDYFDYDMIIRHFIDDPFGEPEHIIITITKTGSAWIPDGQPSSHRLPLHRELKLYKQ